MAFLGIDTPKAAPHYRGKRFAAFLIDLVIVVALWFILFQLIGKPDFFAVQRAMDAADALPVEDQQAAMTEVFALFDEAYRFGLMIWFAYETLTTVCLGGETVGKLITGLKIAPMDAGRNPWLHRLLLVVRSGIKMLSLYLLQGFPFIICGLTVFTTANRSGFDYFVKTQVVEKRQTTR